MLYYSDHLAHLNFYTLNISVIVFSGLLQVSNQKLSIPSLETFTGNTAAP